MIEFLFGNNRPTPKNFEQAYEEFDSFKSKNCRFGFDGWHFEMAYIFPLNLSSEDRESYLRRKPKLSQTEKRACFQCLVEDDFTGSNGIDDARRFFYESLIVPLRKISRYFRENNLDYTFEREIDVVEKWGKAIGAKQSQ